MFFGLDEGLGLTSSAYYNIQLDVLTVFGFNTSGRHTTNLGSDQFVLEYRTSESAGDKDWATHIVVAHCIQESWRRSQSTTADAVLGDDCDIIV